MSTLYICEKPSQARDIARVLGANKRNEHYLEGSHIKVTWCLGHLLETAWPEHYVPDVNPWRIEKLPVIPHEWVLMPVGKTKAQLTAIKRLLKETQHVIIATDADREGEVIARELLDYVGFRGKIQRLWLSALDDSSIRKALANLKENQDTINLYYAGLGRQRADWLIGLNMTMATTCLFQQGKGALSVGRVQTPTLKLIVERDREIENFKPKNYFVLLAQFSNQAKEAFWTKWQVPETEADDEGRCLNKSVAESFAAKIAGQQGVIEHYKEAKKKQSPPLGLSLSALQKLGSSRFGYSAKKTLDIAQSLYETHKATTYPRTDCGYLPESQWQEASAILTSLQKIHENLFSIIIKCDPKIKSPTWDDKKMTAHHAIIPTTLRSVDIQRMSPDERNIYELICRYYLAQFLGDYEYFNRSVTVRCQGELFKASSNTPIALGWKVALQEDNDAEKNNVEDDYLSLIPTLNLKEPVNHTSSKIEEKQTKPPARYTEGTLIEAMKSISKYVIEPALKKVLKETAGIGTEATRATILETLIKRDYIARTGKQLISTEKGRYLIDLLPPVVSDPGMTARWEQELESIAQGTQKLEAFLFQQKDVLSNMLGALSSKRVNSPQRLQSEKSRLQTGQSHPCPQCQKPLQRRQNKQDKRFFWGCSGYPTCRQSFPDQQGKPVMAVISKPNSVYPLK